MSLLFIFYISHSNVLQLINKTTNDMVFLADHQVALSLDDRMTLQSLAEKNLNYINIDINCIRILQIIYVPYVYFFKFKFVS